MKSGFSKFHYVVKFGPEAGALYVPVGSILAPHLDPFFGSPSGAHLERNIRESIGFGAFRPSEKAGLWTLLEDCFGSIPGSFSGSIA